MPRARLLLAAVVITTATCGLAACGGSGDADQSSAAKQAAASLSQIEADATGGATPTAQASSAEGATSQIDVRIANLYLTDANKPGPGLDVYDTQLDGQQATPILTDVPYGSFSTYVHPHLAPNSPNSVTLEVLPTGDDPAADSADAQGLGGVVDDGSHPQVTLALTGTPGEVGESVPLDNLASTTYVEKGDVAGGSAVVAGMNAGPVAPAPPAAESQLLASDAAVHIPDVSAIYFLRIDSACNEPVNGDPNSKGVPEIFAASGSASGFALFPVAAGTHMVSVVATTGGVALTCAQLTAKQGGTSVTTTAGQQTMVLVYGSSLTDLHLAIGPVAP